MLLSRCTRRLDSLVRTSSRHGSRMFPQLKRGDYKKLAESDASILESIVGSKGIKRDDLIRYNTDWLGSVSGNAEIVVSPRSVEEVSAVLAFCNEKKIAVVPQGGNTGLVGGSNPVFDELILSMERMSDITNIDHDAGVVECQAGAILQNIKDNVLQYGYTVPLDLGSRGSCTIGGQPRRMFSTIPSDRTTLTHVDSEGNANMVDIHHKKATIRRAVATCRVHLGLPAFRSVIDNTNKKGDVLSVARVAGIMAGKQTSSLIPLCHTLNLDHVRIEFSFIEDENVLCIESIVQCSGRTGVEMEALCSVSVAALTVHDMCKAINPGIVISGIKLLEKSGGVRGDYIREKE